MRRVQLRGGARRQPARRTFCTLRRLSRAPTKQMGPSHRSSARRMHMATRALWTGSIAFGLVTIPIQLHRAIRDTRPRFRMLHAKDKSPVKFERVCQREGHAVSFSDLVKGYEYEKGKFVVLTREEIETAALDKTSSMDILDFVESEAIDDRFFETPY